MRNLFKALQIIFGYDFGYFNYKTLEIKCVIKCLYVLRCLLVCGLMLHDVNSSARLVWFWYWLYVARHSIYVLIFIFIRSDFSFFMFDQEMIEVDRFFKCESASRSVEKRKIWALILCYLFRASRVLQFCIISYSCSKELFATVLFHIICAGCETLLISMSFIFYSVYYRLVLFKSKLRTGSDDDLGYLLHAYSLLADGTEKFKKAYDFLYLIVILLNVPSVMLATYENLSSFQKNTSKWIEVLIHSILEVVNLSTTTGPALVAGKLSAQTESIITLLYDRLLFEKNELKHRQLKNLIRYMEARPLKFTVYKVFPLDVNLLGMVANFCVTYLIVLLQLTHIY